MTGPRTTARWGVEALTEREQQVWVGIAHGQTNLAIAEELHLTERCIEKHVSSLFWKLSLNGDRKKANSRVLAALAYWQND